VRFDAKSLRQILRSSVSPKGSPTMVWTRSPSGTSVSACDTLLRFLLLCLRLNPYPLLLPSPSKRSPLLLSLPSQTRSSPFPLLDPSHRPSSDRIPSRRAKDRRHQRTSALERNRLRTDLLRLGTVSPAWGAVVRLRRSRLEGSEMAGRKTDRLLLRAMAPDETDPRGTDRLEADQEGMARPRPLPVDTARTIDLA